MVAHMARVTLGSEEVELLAVLDSNVLMDISSCHDAYDTYGELGFDAPAEHRRAIYRRARARESLLLAMYLHKVGAVTYCLYEAATKLFERVPASSPEFPSHFAVVYAQLVQDRLLGGWKCRMDPDPPVAELKGGAADSHLVDFARQHGLPLISNEGLTPEGSRLSGIHKKAARAGVRILAPREFYGAQIDKPNEIASFLERFKTEAPEFFRGEPNERQLIDAVEWTFGYYRHVLLGETVGQDEPVAVTVAPTNPSE